MDDAVQSGRRVCQLDLVKREVGGVAAADERLVDCAAGVKLRAC